MQHVISFVRLLTILVCFSTCNNAQTKSEKPPAPELQKMIFSEANICNDILYCYIAEYKSTFIMDIRNIKFDSTYSINLSTTDSSISLDIFKPEDIVILDYCADIKAGSKAGKTQLSKRSRFNIFKKIEQDNIYVYIENGNFTFDSIKITNINIKGKYPISTPG